MDKPIQVGDLVMVVRASCKHEENQLGIVFRVPALRHDWSYCEICNDHNDNQWHAEKPGQPDRGYPLKHLKRIPPMEELEGVKSQEGIREPA